MVDQTGDDTMSTELENRLDELFGDDDAPDIFADESRNEKADYPLDELKNIVLSIDWEITEEALEKLIEQVEKLKVTYRDDKIVVTFLQILGSLGEYIKTNRGKSHPKAFKVLTSVFTRLDQVVSNAEMPAVQKQKLLRSELNNYKHLRETIVQSKVSVTRKKLEAAHPKTAAAPIGKEEIHAPVTADQEESAVHEFDVDSNGKTVTYKELAQAVDDIKSFIRAEIKLLKNELSQIYAEK